VAVCLITVMRFRANTAKPITSREINVNPRKARGAMFMFLIVIVGLNREGNDGRTSRLIEE
jgi:hypothetical protein